MPVVLCVSSIFRGAYAWDDEMTFETPPAHGSGPVDSRSTSLPRPRGRADGLDREWAGDIFKSDDELEAFLSDLRSNRGASNAEADPVDRFDEEAL